MRLGVGSARWIEGHACRRRVRRGLVRRRGRAPAAGERGQERLRKFAGAKLQHSTVVQAPRMVFSCPRRAWRKVELGRELGEKL